MCHPSLFLGNTNSTSQNKPCFAIADATFSFCHSTVGLSMEFSPDFYIVDDEILELFYLITRFTKILVISTKLALFICYARTV